MSMEKFKSFVKTPAGKLILGCSIVLIGCWSFMFIQFFGGVSSLFPSEEKIKALKMDVRKLRAQVEENRKITSRDALQKKRYREKLITYWNEKRDGLVDTVLRNTIQNAAKELELTLTALGSVRITRINNELYYAEVDNLSASASYDVLIKFLKKLEESKPALHWRRLDLRPDNSRMRHRNSARQSVFQLTPATMQMRFYGAIRVIGYDGKLSIEEMEKSLKKTNGRAGKEKNMLKQKSDVRQVSESTVRPQPVAVPVPAAQMPARPQSATAPVPSAQTPVRPQSATAPVPSAQMSVRPQPAAASVSGDPKTTVQGGKK